MTALEIVLGIDNLVFITVLAGRLPADRQNRARQLGLALALVTRLCKRRSKNPSLKRPVGPVAPEQNYGSRWPFGVIAEGGG